MIEIDGSAGEGGGQIIRSSLALSLITQTPVVFRRIRARRPKPGLARQHLTSVQAATNIGNAKVAGDQLGSQELRFEPGPVLPGDYAFRIGTAGSTTLVLQTVLPPLLTLDGSSRVRVEGGTHNSKAPTIDFVDRAYLPIVNRLRGQSCVETVRRGFYPAGGGEIVAQIEPTQSAWKGIRLLSRGELMHRSIEAIVCGLPIHIAERESATIERLSRWKKKVSIDNTDDPSAVGPGNCVQIGLQFENLTEVFSGFGKRGVRAEQVAKSVWKEADQFLSSSAAVGPYLADQIMLPMALAAVKGQRSSFTTCSLTEHSKTHLDILQRFLPISIVVSDPSENEVRIDFHPAAASSNN